MTVHASGGPMGADQREGSFGVIETCEFSPRPGRMAGLATNCRAIRADLLHSFLELSLVRIQMATRAREFIPVIRNGLRREGIAVLVTIAARDSHVATSQHEPGLFVPHQRKR